MAIELINRLCGFVGSGRKAGVGRLSAGPALVETLECRALLSAAVGWDAGFGLWLLPHSTGGGMALRSGVLTVAGRASAANTIEIGVADGVMHVTLNGKTANFSASRVQRLNITGGSAADTITLDQSVTQPAEIWGRAGNDTILGGAGNDTIWGGDGADSLRGGGGRDHLYGEAGDDTLAGEGRRDWLAGGAGADVLIGESAGDTLFGGAGTDVITWTHQTGTTHRPQTRDKLVISYVEGPGGYDNAGPEIRSVSLPLGGQLVVRVTGHGGVPAYWQVSDIDQTRLAVHSSSQVPLEGRSVAALAVIAPVPPIPPIAGGPFTQAFTFDAIGAGETHLTLDYKDIGGSTLRTLTLTVQIV